MRMDLSASEQRLQRVIQTLNLTAQTNQSIIDGASLIKDAPLHFITNGINLSRQHPILGAALGFGILRSLVASSSQESQAAARIVIAAGLSWWGYYYEALPYLKMAQAYVSGSRNNTLLPYINWFQ